MTELLEKMHRFCPVCKNRYGIKLHRIFFALPANHPLPETVDVMLCNQCGMVFHDSVASDEDYAAYYAHAGKYTGHTTAGAGGYTELEALRFKSRVDFLSPHIQLHSRIVDIGCGKGGLLSVFHSKGFDNTFGIEPSAECVSILQEHGVNGIVGSLFALPDLQPFDLIVVSHVFEHLNTPCDAMQNLKRILRPEGLLYIETPDAEGYMKYFHKPYYYFDLEHINHFSLELLRLLADLNGFEVVSEFQGSDDVQSDFRKPSVGVLLRMRKSGCSKNIVADCQLGKTMKNYIARSAEQDQYPVINGLIESGMPFYIWGVGAFVGRLLAEGRFKGANLKGLIDIDPTKQGLSYAGYNVFSPDVLGPCTESQGVLITAVQYEQVIRKQLIEIGFAGKIYLMD
jgi:SAM-dependent methyltransferase